MTNPTTPNNSTSHSELVNALTADLTRLALSKIALDQYLPNHAEILKKYLQPTGYVYYMRTGPETFQPVLHFQPNSLLQHITQQTPGEIPFFNAIQHVSQTQQPLTLLTQTTAASETQFPNPTPFDHFFSPFILKDQVLGIIHCWTPTSPDTETPTATLLQETTHAIGSFLKSSQIEELNFESARLRTYSYLLDQLCGNFDLENISLILVNYARETIGCERVCLFTPKKQLPINDPNFIEQLSTQVFRINAVSGLKKAHPRSELAVLLSQTTQHIVAQSFIDPNPNGLPHIIERYIQPNNPHSDQAHQYFKITAMNWATAIPLITRDQKACGLLLFEGRKASNLLISSLMRLKNLVQAIGPVIDTSLSWKKNWTLILVNKWSSFFKRNPKKERKKIGITTGLFFAALFIICIFPLPYYVTGEATLHPENVIILPAQRQASVAKTYVQTGQYVHSGEKLLELDTQDVESQLNAVQQEYYRLTAQANNARAAGNEGQMHLFLSEATTVDAHIQKLETDIKKSTLLAPFDGSIIGPSNLNQLRGRIVQTGQELIKLANLQKWIIRTSIRQQDLIQVEKYLLKHNNIEATLNLLALPTETFHFAINTPNQFSFSSAGSLNEFDYFITGSLTIDRTIGTALKAGYKGKTKIYLGWQPIAYQLFRDFKEYLQGKFF